MKYIISLIIISLTVILSCNTKKESSSLLSKDNLPIEKFTINTGRDTVLQTENGALLKISAGSLENKSGSNVTLEIKEAYSIQQIIKAGLYTQSNGQALSSGGMIYINAAAGQEVAFKQKITVAIPAYYLQKGMELYKGEEKADGSINWNNPDTLPENKQLTSIEKGKILFENKCASCHAIGKDLTGPNLAYIKKRFPADEGNYLPYFHWIQAKYFDKGEHFDSRFIYKCNLQSMFGSTGPAFPDFDSSRIYEDILNYIQNESDRLNLSLPQHAYLKDCADSCESYSRKVSSLKYLRTLSEKERQKMIRENGEMTTVIPDTLSRSFLPPITPQDFENKVSPNNFDATYYQFTIESFGWYNIDILLKNIDGVKESELFVRITGEYRERINIFLIIPSHKVYGEGGPAENSNDKYAFFKTDGTLPLPQNEKAFILATTEQNNKIAFSLKEFTTTVKQEFDIELKESTKEKFDAALRDFDAARLHINVNKAKNADSIIARDKEIKDINLQLKDAEKLKPRGCSCNCGIEMFPVADTAKYYESIPGVVGSNKPL